VSNVHRTVGIWQGRCNRSSLEILFHVVLCVCKLLRYKGTIIILYGKAGVRENRMR
jgi:hypothetical protein